ncbi:MAG TPA: glutamyl-tRNA reductase, partial [Candidatus Nitrosotalea sp.]|nr:glutamyl-tRNA reductase [Candidatus Nitrosotalea sp.]
MLFVVGASHKTAPVQLREQLAVKPSQLEGFASHLKSCCELEEIVLLSTCNRVEIYGTMPRAAGKIDSLLGRLTRSRHDFRPHVYVHENAEAARHLFRVVSGLDSMVLGETEITGQVKQAYETTRAAKLTGRTLNRVFQSAFQVVKEIRTRTGIGRGATSIGGAGVQLAERIFGHDLSRQSVMIIGAGQMGEACMRHLTKKGARSILVSNRSFDRAVELAAQFGGRTVRFEDCRAAMAGVDIVVASTRCPKTLLHRADIEHAMVARWNRPLILIDISVPRNIDPEAQGIENVFLYNIDDLNAIVGETVRNRERDL